MDAPGLIDYGQLGDILRVLSTPNRLELLRKLQVPRTSREISLTPFRRDPGRRPDRPLSRQTVEEHVARLQDIGLVQERATTREARPVIEYEVNQARLFLIVEELRRLCLLQTTTGRTAATVRVRTSDDAPEPHAAVKGPCFVLVNGVREGEVFTLAGDGPWSIGRGTASVVSIPYDPFLGREHATVRRSRSRFELEPSSSAANPVRVNWSPPLAGVTSLQAGDVVGLGRSLLVFRSE